MSRRALVCFVLIVIAVLWISAQFAIKARGKYSTTSTFSDSATGVSIFYDLAQKTGSTTAAIKRSAILSDKDFNGVDLFLLLSPRQPISEREAGLLSSFVKRGGALVMSFESERSWQFLQPLLAIFEQTIKATEDPNFKNRTFEPLAAKSSSLLLNAGTTYGFYSRLILSDDECKRDRLSCFFRETSHGKGTVYLLAGLPLVGNVLLPLEENRQIAFRLLELYDNLMFDEYRHFFSEKTLKDLLLTPSFSLPLLGLTLGALGFFLFGYSELHDAGPKSGQTVRRTGYHDLNSGIFLGLLDRSGSFADAVDQQRRHLEHLFPKRREEIAKSVPSGTTGRFVSEAHSLEHASTMVDLHRRFLEEKSYWAKKS